MDVYVIWAQVVWTKMNATIAYPFWISAFVEASNHYKISLNEHINKLKWENMKPKHATYGTQVNVFWILEVKIVDDL